MTVASRTPVFFLPHGGGPCFFMEPPPAAPILWDKMAAFLRGIPERLATRPRAIVVVSGHWETPVPAVTTSPAPPLLFDYYGFPPHTYELRYPAPGDPALAVEIRALLTKAGIPSAEDPARGLDHGVFVPFMVAFPDATIPVVELSIQQNLDPAAHIAIGHALAPLRDNNVLIVGTGLTFHNLRDFFRGGDPRPSEAFDDWLLETVEAAPAAREARLITWQSAPYARDCQPRPDHLLPLMIAAGAADGDAGQRIYNEHVMGKAQSGYQFG